MTWPTPKYSRTQVDKAGAILRSSNPSAEDLDEALSILGNWRSAHGYPLNTFQATLRARLKSIDQDALVAQRLKRAESVIAKLRRFPKMKLSRMQDIGGLRAVVSDLKRARRLADRYRSKKGFSHELVREHDYIEQPKQSGYRSIHLIYRYKNNRAPEYSGLFIELQIRTRLQHTWATAVETMGTFLNEPLKASEGSDEWLNFFKLASAAFSHLEGTAPVPGYEGIKKTDVFRQLLHEAKRLHIATKLDGFRVATDRITSDGGRGAYHLIVLDLSRRSLRLRPYSKNQLDEAIERYVEYEKQVKRGENLQVVLVSAGDVRNLRNAYPNYFLDVRGFNRQLRRIEEIVKS